MSDQNRLLSRLVIHTAVCKAASAGRCPENLTLRRMPNPRYRSTPSVTTSPRPGSIRGCCVDPPARGQGEAGSRNDLLVHTGESYSLPSWLSFVSYDQVIGSAEPNGSVW